MLHPSLPSTPTTAEAPLAMSLRHGSPTPCTTLPPTLNPPLASNLNYSPLAASGRVAPPPFSALEPTPTLSSSWAGGAPTPCSATSVSKPPPTPIITLNACSNTGVSPSLQEPTLLMQSISSLSNSRPPSHGSSTPTLTSAPKLRASTPPKFPTLTLSVHPPSLRLWPSVDLQGNGASPAGANADLGVERVG